MTTPTLFPFRIEARAKNAPAAPWNVCDLAHTPEQAAMMLTLARRAWPEFDFQSAPNEWLSAAPVVFDAGELAALREFKQSVIDHTGTTDPIALAGAFKLSREIAQRVAQLDARESEITAREKAAATPPPPVPPRELGFAAGDFVRDRHSQTVGRVTEICEVGFVIETPEGTHHVPRECEDYEKLSTKEAAPFVKAAKAAAKAAADAKAAVAEHVRAALPNPPVLPFGVGDTVRDVHTGALIRVTAIGVDSKAGGFDWEHTDPTAAEKSGTIPLIGVQYFELIK